MTKFLIENENFSGNFEERPNNECVRQRLSEYGADIARRLEQIADASWLLRPIIRAGIAQECTQDFQQIINEIKLTNNNTQKLEELFEKFVNKHCIISLLCIYTLPSPVMSTIIRDNFVSYATLIYMNLKTMKPNRSYQGRSYRAALVTSRDMINYRAAMLKGNLVETRLFSSTSENRRVAETFTIGGQSCDSHSATIIFDFTKRPCETALDLTFRRHDNVKVATVVPDEEEVLVLPFTLFRVIDIDADSYIDEYQCKRWVITLQNIPVPKRSLVTLVQTHEPLTD
ncbi:unnamed protein product [Rotaria socialis]|uniref:NAD(+)--protein-arginine ADP-ribosyltransferase n=1 Tax=Rotaria socialis TaxID=392032 RepID=A0A820K0N3_9BILA|nr:unnamed protein product [Rotaria socialis]CAF4332452.1 unnamed protein product [Rotaria socialis]